MIKFQTCSSVYIISGSFTGLLLKVWALSTIIQLLKIFKGGCGFPSCKSPAVWLAFAVFSHIGGRHVHIGAGFTWL